MQRNSPPNHAILSAAATDAEVDDVEDTPFRVKRVDTLKMCFLLVAPLFFLFSHWIPFRGSPPSLQDLQQTLQDLDEECYKQSGCLELPGVLARCEKQRASCPDAYYYELRQLNRNCRALSTQKLEDCLLQVPSGKCIFEHPVRWCNVTEILECSETAMSKLLKNVLLPPFASLSNSEMEEEEKKGEGGGGGEAAPLSEEDLGRFGVWELALHGAYQASKVAQESSKAISLLGWALTDGNLSATDDDYQWKGSAQELFANISSAAQLQPPVYSL